MPVGAGRRFTLVEYADPAPLAARIASETGLPPSRARDAVLAAGERAGSILGTRESPLRWTGERVRAENCAGLLLLSDGIELEIAPKFLGTEAGWREDFFLLATLAHHGRLLDSEGLRASGSVTSDLATLIGRSLVEMYWRNHRRPLRTYRRLRVADFAVDGDFDAADLLMPDEQGFEQVLTSFTRANPFNAVIRAAADALAPVVPDPETRARLERVAHSLPRQSPPGRLQDRRLPSRGRAWQATYDLSLDILRGLGGAYDPGAAIAPGYIVSTWQVWETLVALALRTAFGQRSVRSQAEFRLGDRQRAGATSALNVTPDNVAQIMGSTVVLDAKYKGRVGARKQGVDAPDVYEALAFMRAAGVDRAVLVYPRVPDGTLRQPGFAAEMERIKVSGTTIVAIEVTVSGIARPQGLKTFIAQLRGEIEHLVPTI